MFIFIFPLTLNKFSYPDEKQSASDTKPHVSLMTHDEVETSKCFGVDNINVLNFKKLLDTTLVETLQSEMNVLN